MCMHVNVLYTCDVYIQAYIENVQDNICLSCLSQAHILKVSEMAIRYTMLMVRPAMLMMVTAMLQMMMAMMMVQSTTALC